ncbi:hypothetical protein Tco_1049509, partial [Tanacetum coccineum]
EVLSWLFIGGNFKFIAILRNIIALLRLAIGSSVGRNDGTINLESICVDGAVDMDAIEKVVDYIVDL